MNAASRGLDPVQASALREAAARVAASPALAKSHRLAVLFNHLVEALIEGRADTLKEFSIAADVFGRDASFDPKTDSTVRTQTLRLRERLELYYAREGAADPIRIWLAKGSYVLRHEPRTESIAGPASLEPSPLRGHLPVRIEKIAAAAAALLLVAVVVAVIWMKAPSHRPDVHDPIANFRRLGTPPGPKIFCSLSPDGRSLVYANNARGKWDIYLQPIDGAAVNLTADSSFDEGEPAFSPDGTRIAFRGQRDGGGVYVMKGAEARPAR